MLQMSTRMVSCGEKQRVKILCFFADSIIAYRNAAGQIMRMLFFWGEWRDKEVPSVRSSETEAHADLHGQMIWYVLIPG